MTAILVMATSMVAMSAPRAWESVDRVPALVAEMNAQADDVVAVVVDSYLYLSLRQRSTVKLFTILGQPVAQDCLAPGCYRFRMTSRGIYLLKVGDVTRRITI